MYLGLDKYNLRAHVVQFSKRKAKEKREKEIILQGKFKPTKIKAISIGLNKNWNFFMNKKFKVSSFEHGHEDGCEHGEKSMKYFLNLKKRKHVKNIWKNSENWRLVVRSLLIRSKFFVRKNISTKNYIRARIWVTSKQQKNRNVFE